jgi:hypothetical protein
MNKKNYPEKDVEYRVKLCEDGVYRWRYDLNLFKNLSIFFLVWKILFVIFLCIFAVVVIADIKNWGITQERLMYNFRFLCYFLIGMTVVTALGYFLYAAIMGGKYCVIFEMDENGINHKQIDEQAEKAKKLAKTTFFAGAASGSFSTMGAGMNSARYEMYSEFSRIRKVKAYPKRNLIKMNERLNHNQIYADKDDFEFVENFIVLHCENVK